MNLWSLSRILRKNAPEICNVSFHAPKSYNYVCDCTMICKWPPRGNIDAKPIFLDNMLSRVECREKESRYASVLTIDDSPPAKHNIVEFNIK